jgi:hypothetical protein
VGLVGDHHHVAALGQDRVGRTGLGRELLDRGEDDPARGSVQRLLQVLAAVSLNRLLADQVGAHRKGAEQLVVEIVAVGDHHDGRVFQLRQTHQLASVEGHQEALARTLGVPDDPNPPVAGTVVAHTRQPIVLGVLPRRIAERVGNRPQGGGDGTLHGVELVVAGDDLHEPAAHVAEHGEVAQQGEQPGTLEDPLDQHRELGLVRRGDVGSVRCAPRHEALGVRGQRTDPRLQPI